MLRVKIRRGEVEFEEELQALVTDLRGLIEHAAMLGPQLVELVIFGDEVEYAGHVSPGKVVEER